jgi:hypothetical protein
MDIKVRPSDAAPNIGVKSAFRIPEKQIKKEVIQIHIPRLSETGGGLRWAIIVLEYMVVLKLECQHACLGYNKAKLETDHPGVIDIDIEGVTAGFTVPGHILGDGVSAEDPYIEWPRLGDCLVGGHHQGHHDEKDGNGTSDNKLHKTPPTLIFLIASVGDLQ